MQNSSIGHHHKEILEYLIDYFKNPVQSIRKLPQWGWPSLLILQASLAGISGLMAFLIKPSVRRFLEALFVLPLSSIITTFIITVFFHYTFYFFFRREISLKEIFTLLFLSNIPFFFLYILHPLVPPIVLLGMAVTSLLLIIGLVENFALPKKTIIRLIGSLFIFYLIIWTFQQIRFTAFSSKNKELKTLPGSIDILEKELSD
ncbi:MAG: YIP1 family protein [Bdellovibrio sp.]|nr:MAG: YIP1 family protein [Bdellovibrio sp.]